MGAATLAASLAAGLAVGLAFEAGLPGHCSLAPPSLQTYLVGFGFLFAGDVMVFALGFCAYYTPRAVTFLLAIVLCASPAVLPPILEIAQFIATLREMPFSTSDAMIGLFVSASMIRCLLLGCLWCQNSQALSSSSGFFASLNTSITTLFTLVMSPWNGSAGLGRYSSVTP